MNSFSIFYSQRFTDGSTGAGHLEAKSWPDLKEKARALKVSSGKAKVTFGDVTVTRQHNIGRSIR
jgi:hypothetical protein